MPGILVDKKLLDDDPSEDSSEEESSDDFSSEESDEEEDSDEEYDAWYRPREPPREPARQEVMANMMTELVNMRKDMGDMKTMIKEIHLMVEALAINRGINVAEVLAQRPMGPTPGPTADAPVDVATTTNVASQPHSNSSAITTTTAVDTPMPDAAAA